MTPGTDPRPVAATAPAPAGIGRRSVVGLGLLTIGGAALPALGACSLQPEPSSSTSGAPASTGSPSDGASAGEDDPQNAPEGDEALVLAALAAERDIAALADAVVRRLGAGPGADRAIGAAGAAGAAGVLRAVRGVHRDHVALLQGAAPRPSAPTPEATPPPRAAAVTALARAESSLVDLHLRAVAQARSGALARLLAGLAAAAAQQGALLEQVRTAEGRARAER